MAILTTQTLQEFGLLRLEGLIQHSLPSFRSVGAALLAIRADRLYESTHDDWPTYLRDRWGLSEGYASRQIGAAGAAQDLAEVPGPQPTSERQVRPLLPLPADERRAVWAEACAGTGEGEVPTSGEVEDAVALWQQSSPAEKQAALEASSERLRDQTTRDARGECATRVRRLLGRVLGLLRDIVGTGPAAKEITLALAGLDQLVGGG